jgi:two-component system sensor kinase FixL
MFDKLTDLINISSVRDPDLFLTYTSKEIPGAVWNTDKDLRITFSNGTGLIDMGLKVEEILGLTLFDVFKTIDSTSMPIAAHLRALQGESIQLEAEIMGRFLQGFIEPVYNNSGEIVGTAGMVIDITESKKNAHALELSERRYRELFDNAIDAIMTLDLQGKIVTINRASERILNASSSELVGQDVLAVVAPEYHDLVRQMMARKLSEQVKVTSYELEAISREGRRLTLDLRSRLIFEEDNAVGIQIVARDITEQKRIQNELLASEEKFRTLAENTQAIIYILQETKFVYVNPAMEHLIGYSSAELLQMHFWEVLHPDHLETVYQRYQARMRGEDLPSGYEIKVINRSGDTIWIFINNTFFTFLGKPSIIVSGLDITSRKIAEEAMKQQNEYLAALFYNTPDGVALCNNDNRILDINERFKEMFGYSREECIGKEPGQLLIPPLLQHEYEEHIRSTLSGQIVSRETIRLKKDGELLDVILKIVKAGDYGYYVMYSDISERKQAEQLIQAQFRELEAKNTEMERFTYTASHDLRSPLITIRGFAGLLLEDIRQGKLERVEKDLQRILNAASKMDDLLQGLLELSRIGRMLNPFKEFSMSELVVDVAELLSGSLNQKEVTLVIQPDMPRVIADESRIGQVLQNLVENAIKFMGDSENPQVEIGYKESPGEYIFFVSDNGVGIDPRYHDTIFGLFDKLDPHSPGTGIGLSLVRRIIEFHQGRVWVESDGPDKGSTFYFSLPNV